MKFSSILRRNWKIIICVVGDYKPFVFYIVISQVSRNIEDNNIF